MTQRLRPSLRRLASDFRPYARVGLAATGVVTLSQVAASAGPLLVGIAIDRGVIARHPGWLLFATLAYSVVAVLTIVCGYWEIRLMGEFAQDFMCDLRLRLLDHLFFLDLDFFGRERSGRLVSRLTSDVENLQQFIEGGLSLALRAGLVGILTLALMLILSPELTLVTLLVISPLMLATRWFRRRAYETQVDVRDRVSGLLTRLGESLLGMRVIQAYVLEREQLASFRAVNMETYTAKMRSAGVVARYYPAVEFLQPASLAAVLGVGAYGVTVRHQTIGVVVSFTLYVGVLFQPLLQFTELAYLLQAAMASFAKIHSFEGETPNVRDADGAVDLVPGGGELVLEAVSFRYGAGQRDALSRVDLVIPGGQRVVLAGQSGAGKSTLAKIIARFYDPTSGRVLVDGQDASEVRLASLRRHMTLVPQEGFLFDGTVAENIAAARPDAAVEEVAEVCAILGLTPRLASLPSGLETRVSNRGLSLSAGQRQLVSLARAYLASPGILLLDEATSSLDPATEALVGRALEKLLRGRTAIIVAHRVHTAMRSDRVIMLENGAVVADGDPRTLAAVEGPFRRWVSSTPESVDV
ncbi:MAG: ABC transporter ATP-binding protein [Candidatus Dormibacteria bacterium]